MALYQYTGLKDKDHVRLLDIHSTDEDNDSPITCSLAQVAKADKPRYIALSYTWEIDDSDTYTVVQEDMTITCDGAKLSVTPNLHAALRILRSQEGDGGESAERLPFWIDAICINQQDDVEKGQQIKVMHTVYSQADRVIAWLGEEQVADHGAEAAFNQLSVYIASRNEDVNADEVMQHYENPGLTDMPRHQGWAAINSILSKRWFTRAWIIQEVVMAPQVSLQCGKIKLDLSMIQDVMLFICSSPLVAVSSLQESKRAFNMLATVAQAQLALEQSRSLTIMDVLWLTRYFGAKVPKDRFFALLGVITPRADPLLTPDYGLSDAEIYIRLATQSVLEAEPLKCLSLAKPSKSSLVNTLPTWVPDWEAASVLMCLSWNASFKTLTSYPSHLHLSDCRKLLTLGGLQVDTIQAVGRMEAGKDEWAPRGTAYPGALEIATLANFFIEEAKEISEEIFSPHEYPIEMFWRTLIFNSTHGVQSTCSQAPAEYFQSFKAYSEILRRMFRPDNKRSSVFKGSLQVTPNLYLKAMDYDRAFANYSNGRTFGVTKDLRMGMFPTTVRQGDVIFAPLGAKVPFVIRKANDGYFELVGECYLHGVMYGELADEKGWKENIQEITLC